MGILSPTFYQGADTLPWDVLSHYTSRRALQSIVRAGELRPHRALPGDRCPLLWCSTNGVWEPASGRSWTWTGTMPMTFDQYE